MPASNVCFHFILCSWKGTVEAQDVNCSPTKFVRMSLQSLSTNVYPVLPFTSMFALQTLIMKSEHWEWEQWCHILMRRDVCVVCAYLLFGYMGLKLKCTAGLHSFHLHFLSFSLHSFQKSSWNILKHRCYLPTPTFSHSPKHDVNLPI